jgi:hypothetical protein
MNTQVTQLSLLYRSGLAPAKVAVPPEGRASGDEAMVVE